IQNFNRPVQTFNRPVQNFNRPVQNFNRPVQTFTPPTQTSRPFTQTGFTPRPVGAFSPVSPLKLGPGRPVFNASLKPGQMPVRPPFPVVSMHNQFWPVLKGRKFIWFGGYRRFFIPVGLLGVALIGGSYWYPDGYVSISGPACTGFTPDGCQLQWRTVNFEDGGSAAQCVQYCPQAGPPPAQALALPPAPALAANGSCQLTIYGETNFGGI